MFYSLRIKHNYYTILLPCMIIHVCVCVCVCRKVSLQSFCIIWQRNGRTLRLSCAGHGSCVSGFTRSHGGTGRLITPGRLVITAVGQGELPYHSLTDKKSEWVAASDDRRSLRKRGQRTQSCWRTSQNNRRKKNANGYMIALVPNREDVQDGLIWIKWLKLKDTTIITIHFTWKLFFSCQKAD